MSYTSPQALEVTNSLPVLYEQEAVNNESLLKWHSFTSRDN